ncbi:phosphate uptake regulator PhoU [Thermoclostridium stercorarium subsp. stercorarium DSM 8532]|jgi:phosphate transport system protein|uniref:Phosphate-specific transport system accessory protein PhoU n=3 Tax=Thermoclostridium stercorarium TaxID=1510 RepID=L7VQW0_THES1|nr:phosphate signaling complex protein PhoU [Thermoclostridium stercorarium]AGC69182.1 phosphate uptake regulator PhoU [Thermoclostridium stercorarium subsp. stercorarium DSM 8532]AGI40153.1 PhoU [Thermoclostridium stercorarium subsp. stercorarium DSM 8532]ANW99460.1 phosphate transport system regulatory protein PhoU [Thermoclostridium stercorarium subsp. thermolacticum DSM 2910]ANX02086.1 phosphate transport system regulatory protein PhoU [Thermoclostridium stercorarium subsp. leptospartum DSM
MRSKFDEQLENLNKALIQMGALCEEAIENSAGALMTGNFELAEKAIMIDEKIDQKEREIENLCLRLLLQQQPVAGDLRLISAALKMITDMERIGDQAADISDIIIIGKIRAENGTLYIGDMANATIKMVTQSIDAFVNRDLKLAVAVIDYDDAVDELFTRVRNELIKRIENKTVNGEYAIDLIMIAKYFERIGDHATNIAEWVEFAITGRHRGEGDA